MLDAAVRRWQTCAKRHR